MSNGHKRSKSSKTEVPRVLESADSILLSVEKLEIGLWKYLEEIEPEQHLHIGPYAEDFRKAFGLGDGEIIPVVDACGVLFSCIKALAARIAELNDKITNVQRQSRGRTKRQAPLSAITTKSTQPRKRGS